MLEKNSNFLCLCYHYLKPAKIYDNFPRIMGLTQKEFRNHIKLIKENFEIISEEQLLELIHGKYFFQNEKPGILFTFDDGLSDHYEAAKILKEFQIKGIFFLPTCILEDNLPANPIIIHYSIAIFGIEKFLYWYHQALSNVGIDSEKFQIKYQKGKNNVWLTIDKIKNNFKYNFKYKESRKILLYIYDNLMLPAYPNAMEFMHLTHEKTREMLEMGHSIGVHTHSHISVGAQNLSKNDFEAEIIKPKIYLENHFKTKISSFSYPFGDKKDCLSSIKLLNKTNEYQLAFTVEKKVNSNLTNPLEIGRYQPTSTEDSQQLLKILMDLQK